MKVRYIIRDIIRNVWYAGEKTKLAIIPSSAKMYDTYEEAEKIIKNDFMKHKELAMGIYQIEKIFICL